MRNDSLYGNRQGRLRLTTTSNYSVDCSQSPIFPWDRRCRSLSSTPPSWSLDASETGESTKCPWVVAVGFMAYEPYEPLPYEPHRHYPRAFCTLPSFARIERPRWRPVELNDRHLRSHGKIGDCEQSIFYDSPNISYRFPKILQKVVRKPHERSRSCQRLPKTSLPWRSPRKPYLKRHART